MCDGHSNVFVDIGHKMIGVDGCIAPLVKALNDAGYRTLASCCGHGNQPANIPLLDLDGVERWLILTTDRAEGEWLMWPTDATAEDPARSMVTDPDTTGDER